MEYFIDSPDDPFFPTDHTKKAAVDRIIEATKKLTNNTSTRESMPQKKQPNDGIVRNDC